MTAATWLVHIVALIVIVVVIGFAIYEVLYRIKERSERIRIEVEQEKTFWRATNRQPYDWEVEGL